MCNHKVLGVVVGFLMHIVNTVKSNCFSLTGNHITPCRIRQQVSLGWFGVPI